MTYLQFFNLFHDNDLPMGFTHLLNETYNPDDIIPYPVCIFITKSTMGGSYITWRMNNFQYNHILGAETREIRKQRLKTFAIALCNMHHYPITQNQAYAVPTF